MKNIFTAIARFVEWSVFILVELLVKSEDLFCICHLVFERESYFTSR